MSAPTEEQAPAAKDGAMSSGSNPSIDRASAAEGVKYSVNLMLSKLVEDMTARENEDKKKIEELQVENRRAEEKIEALESDNLELENKVSGFKGIEKSRLESEQKATDFEEQNKELKRQGKQKDKKIKRLEEFKERILNVKDESRCSMSPAKDESEDEAAVSPVRQVVDAPKAAFSFPSPARTDGVEPAASPVLKVGATNVDAAPSFNLEEDDDGFITAPEGPEASGENKDGKKVDQTLQVVCEKQGAGAEAGASNVGENGKASPSSVHGLHAKADEGGGEELEAEARAEQQEGQDAGGAASLDPCAGDELARTRSEKKKKRETRVEAKEGLKRFRARMAKTTPKKTPRKNKATKKTTAKRRRSARLDIQKGDAQGTLWESED